MSGLEIYAVVDKQPKKDPIKKDLKTFMDNVFKVDVAHSRLVVSKKFFFNIATSVGLLLILISFKTQDYSVNCIVMLFWDFFSD